MDCEEYTPAEVYSVLIMSVCTVTALRFLIPVALKPEDRHRTVQPFVPASSLVAFFIFFGAKALVRGDGRIPQSCL
jgi:hypothetical protein